jgi:hypothetical protein
MKSAGIVLLLWFLFLPSRSFAAAADIFLMIGDVKGECSDKKHCTFEIDNATGLANGQVTTALTFIGSELLVAFLTGDPDHPIVTGTVWNGVDISPGGSFTGTLPCPNLPCQLSSVDFTARLGSKFLVLSNGDTFFPDSDVVRGGLGDLLVRGQEIPSATPEPSSLLLLGSGLCALAGRIRRR